jgi:hypothetical protein
MFDFYNLFYNMNYLSKEDVYEAARWGCITKEEYKKITKEDYMEP